jgi:DnaK suppressor protein
MALTREQTIELNAVVEERRDALLRELREDAARSRGEQYSEIAGDAPDAGDQAVAALIADLGQADLGRDLDELRAVEAARQRLREGRYGVCVECGNEIDYARLRASPAAIRCIDCQRRHERTFLSPGGSSL